MRAVQIDAYGGPENQLLRDIATPEPGPGEALVRLEYAGVNYTDVYNRNGMYANDAHRILEARETRGKLLLKIG